MDSRGAGCSGSSLGRDQHRKPIRATDFEGYKQDFLNLFGFEIEGVDYEAEVNPQC